MWCVKCIIISCGYTQGIYLCNYKLALILLYTPVASYKHMMRSEVFTAMMMSMLLFWVHMMLQPRITTSGIITIMVMATTTVISDLMIIQKINSSL